MWMTIETQMWWRILSIFRKQFFTWDRKGERWSEITHTISMEIIVLCLVTYLCCKSIGMTYSFDTHGHSIHYSRFNESIFQAFDCIPQWDIAYYSFSSSSSAWKHLKRNIWLKFTRNGIKEKVLQKMKILPFKFTKIGIQFLFLFFFCFTPSHFPICCVILSYPMLYIGETSDFGTQTYAGISKFDRCYRAVFVLRHESLDENQEILAK